MSRIKFDQKAIIERIFKLYEFETQEPLCKKWDVKQTAISNYKKGSRPLKLEWLVDIAIEKEVSLDWLVFNKGPKKGGERILEEWQKRYYRVEGRLEEARSRIDELQKKVDELTSAPFPEGLPAEVRRKKGR